MTVELYYEIVEELVSNKYNKKDPTEESEYYGMKEDYDEMITNIMNTYFNIFKDTKTMINTNSERIKENIAKKKEDEKEDIKNQFNLLNDENRKIEREMKNLKLGEWSIGLSKSIFQYDPAMYDREVQNQQRLNQLLQQNEIALSAPNKIIKTTCFHPYLAPLLIY